MSKSNKIPFLIFHNSIIVQNHGIFQFASYLKFLVQFKMFSWIFSFLLADKFYGFLSISFTFYSFLLYILHGIHFSFLKRGGGFDFLILEQLLFKPMEKLSMGFFLLGDVRLIPPFLISHISFLGYHSSLDGVYPLVTSLEMVCGR